LLAIATALLWLFAKPPAAVRAADLTVCPAGPPTCQYTTIQAAVDAALDGDLIRVATGTYSGVHQRAGTSQTVYISKTVTLRGGYSPDFSTWDAETYPTTLDAQGQGRVVYITGGGSPEIEGLRITGGDATGLGGTHGVPKDAGGGVYVFGADVTIRYCVVYGNAASQDAKGYGGGMFLWASSATLDGNTVQGNTASTAEQGYGGGIYFDSCDEITLSGNMVQGNMASTAAAGHGGGLYLHDSESATLSGNRIVSNTAALPADRVGRGGGLVVKNSRSLTLTNTLVADNHANTEGSGVWWQGDSSKLISGTLLHSTIADNGGSGQAVYVGDYTTLDLKNTIITGHDGAGVYATSLGTAALDAILWYGNGAHTTGQGIIVTGTVNISGDPGFIAPDQGDYHIGPDSAAVDAGIDAGVFADIDGDPRPAGCGFDIGADELLSDARCHAVFLPLILLNTP
jgi:parallel beta-helix repeat protein